jgi:hypothetical protein
LPNLPAYWDSERSSPAARANGIVVLWLRRRTFNPGGQSETPDRSIGVTSGSTLALIGPR